MKIAVILNDERLSRDLAVRLAELRSGLVVNVFAGGNIQEEEYDFVVTEEVLNDFFPADVLLAHITDRHVSRGGRMPGGRSDKPGTIHVHSMHGGSGCTSFAIAMGRVIAGQSSGRTLLVLASDNRGSDYYSLGGISRPFSEEELDYVIKQGVKRNLEIYMKKDRYGLYSVKYGGDVGKLVTLLDEDYGFEFIIIESGSNTKHEDFIADVDVNLVSAADSRGQAAMSSAVKTPDKNNAFTVVNFAGYRETRSRTVMIPEDMDSFVHEGSAVEISMKGAFAEVAGSFVQLVMAEKEDGL